MSTQTSKHGARLSAIGLVLGLFALQAQAQSQPWYLGAQQRFEHQTNVFGTSAGQVSDTVSMTSLLAGLDQPFGRQRLFASAVAGTNRYQNRSELNHESYSVRLGLDWETAGRLSGNITADASERLADFAPLGLLSTSSNNTTRTRGLAGVVRVGVVTRLTAEIGGATRSTRFDNVAYQIRNVDIDEIYGAVKYRPAGSLVLGVGLRTTRGEYPNFRQPALGVFTPEGFDRDNIDLTAEWPVSAASRVDARLSYGRDRYDTLTARDYSGVTGALTWRWQPTGRTTVTTAYVRTAGDDTTLTTVPGQLPYATAATRVQNLLGTAVDYELTGKIKLRGALSFSEASAVDLIRSTTASEFVSTVYAGLVWEATRAIRAGCDLTLRNRATRSGVAGYDANTVGCFGEFVLR